MPQIDKVSFYSIIAWLFTIYVVGYVISTVKTLHRLFILQKIYPRYRLYVTFRARIVQKQIFIIGSFPYVQDALTFLKKDLKRRQQLALEARFFNEFNNITMISNVLRKVVLKQDLAAYKAERAKSKAEKAKGKTTK
jgi:hypothetical protein